MEKKKGMDGLPSFPNPISYDLHYLTQSDGFGESGTEGVRHESILKIETFSFLLQ